MSWRRRCARYRQQPCTFSESSAKYGACILGQRIAELCSPVAIPAPLRAASTAQRCHQQHDGGERRNGHALSGKRPPAVSVTRHARTISAFLHRTRGGLPNRFCTRPIIHRSVHCWRCVGHCFVCCARPGVVAVAARYCQLRSWIAVAAAAGHGADHFSLCSLGVVHRYSRSLGWVVVVAAAGDGRR